MTWQFCPMCGATLEPGSLTCGSCGRVLPTDPTTAGAPEVALETAESLAQLEEDLREALSPSYVVLKRLGTGGMGSVFLAREPALKRLVAVKVLSPTLAVDPGARARFAREAQAVAQLSHPNIVAIYSVGQLADETPYFVMQYVGGRSMSERIETDGPLQGDEARLVLGEVASALAAAHDLGIIHRDIKPANILYDDETGRVLVSDFGIAAVRPRGDAKGTTRLTQTGMAIGTPHYMSPEQLLAEDVTDKTDVYSLGLFGYEMVVGTGPFTGTSPQELVAAHLRDTPKPMSETVRHVDPEFESAVGACLSKNANDRPSAREIAQRFNPAAGVLLEWPAPGLGHLQGALKTVTTMLAVGSTLAGVGLIVLFSFGPTLSSAVTSALMVLIFVSGTIGILALIVASVKLVRMSGRVAAAVRAGYGWAAVAETLADRRRDAGALIAGMREYATVSPPGRDALRRGRLVKEGGLFAAAVLPVLLMLPVVRLAGGGWVGPASVPLVLFGPSLLCLLVAVRSERRERQVVGTARRTLARHRGERGGDSRLVSSWGEAFESVRRGQPLGRGPTTRPAAGRWGAWAVSAAMAATVIVLAPVSLVGVFGPVIWQIVIPKFSNTEDRAIVANAARDFAAPIDSTITPLEAGRAYYSLLNVGGVLGSSDVIPEHPVPMDFPEPYFAQELPGHLFRATEGESERARAARSPFAGNAPNHLNILEYAAGGLTEEEVRYLEHLAALPQWDAWSTVARAADMDYIGARFVVPFPDSAHHFALPIPKFTVTKEAAYASVVRAALFLGEGRLEEAELALRETIGVGFKIVDQLTLIESLIGVVIAGIGRDALVQFYTITDRPEAVVLRSRVEAARTSVESTEAWGREALDGNDVASIRASMLATVASEGRLRGLSVELLSVLSFAPCTNVQELLLGPRDDITRAVARARAIVAHSDAEQHFVDMVIESRDRGVSMVAHTPAPLRVVRAVARFSAFVLGNPRIAGCTMWITGIP